MPAALPLQTKAELALARLEEATAGGVQHACVTGEADYGANPQFLNGLAERRERYVVAVRATCSGTLGRGHPRPVRRAAEGLAAQPLQHWQTLAWSEGAKGGWRAKWLARRCGRVEGEGTRHGRGQTGEWQYCWSAFPADTPLAVLVEYAQRRHGVEHYQEEAKTELGWDQSQGRRWDGFQRHALTMRLSYSFLVWLEGREREQRKVRGRPRAAFSPAAGPPAAARDGGPSPGERMAALYCHSRIDRTRAH